MLILGIETATERVSVAIGNHEGVLAMFEVTRGRRHAETLTPAIEFVCHQADIKLAEISVIAVDVGPGLFTGMRVGLAAGKVMAHALGIGIIPLSSLDLLAHPVRHTEKLIASVIDARKGEVFYALYRQTSAGVSRVMEPKTGTIDELLIALSERAQDTVCVGDGAVRYRDEITNGYPVEFAEPSFAFPSSAALVQMAYPRAVREDWVDPAAIQAMYLRQPDAEINWSTRHSGPGGAA